MSSAPAAAVLGSHARPNAGATDASSSMQDSPAAYAFAILGRCDAMLEAQLIASTTILNRTRPRFPLISLVGCEDPGKNAALCRRLQHAGIRPVVIDVRALTSKPCRGKYWDLGRNKSYSFRHTMGTLALWNLTRYQVLLFIDSDAAVLRNVDHIIEMMLGRPEVGHAVAVDGCPTLSAAAASSQINTGVWAVRPSQTAYRSLTDFWRGSMVPCELGDQTVAQHFFRLTPRRRAKLAPFEQVRLHQGYNLQTQHQRVPECLRASGLNLSQAFILHWAGPRKPSFRDEPHHTSDPVEAPAFREYRKVYCTSLAHLGGQCSSTPSSTIHANTLATPL